MGTVLNIFWGPDYFGADGHAGTGFRFCSNTNTSPCVSSRKHRTKRRRSCASRPRPTSSPAFSCSSAESAQTIWAFGPLQQPTRLQGTGQRSGRRSSASMRCACPITRCSVCWSGAGWRLNELGKDNGNLFYSSFLWFMCWSWVRVYKDSVFILVRQLPLFGIFTLVFCSRGIRISHADTLLPIVAV